MTIPPHATDSHTYEHNPNFINVAPSKKSFHSEHPPRDYSPVSSDPHPYHIPNGHQHLAQPKDNRRFPENVQQIHHYYQNQTQFRSQDHDDEGDGDDEHELKGMAGDSGVDDAMSALRMRRQSHEVSSMNSSSSSSVRSSNNGDEPFSPIDRDLQSSSAKSVTAKSKKSGQATTVTGRKTGPRKRKNDGESPEVKRQKFLERNRMAASKCREKKRLQTLKTISDADEISARNQALHETLDELQEEVRRLKNQILCHHDCGCDVIQKFVQSSFDYDSSSCTSSSSSSSISNDSNGPSSGHRHHATAAFASEMHVVSMPSFRI
ncbi:hypothetical protein BGX23_009951 [Mortierella sp. AD031]|nr:hypothetical protein BGX23_009951 [Mortierella sp. AD031]KAG0214524.1 hypothetical protein BGX33_002066 [Mortierella sp. NVP41]